MAKATHNGTCQCCGRVQNALAFPESSARRTWADAARREPERRRNAARALRKHAEFIADLVVARYNKPLFPRNQEQ